jgi:anti-sigma factor RsiW
MSDRHAPFAARHGLEPGDEAARASRHAVLIELLGAYADGELPAETTSQIDAHLLGCARCRGELAIHESLRGRLAIEPPSGGSPALRARIAAAIDAAPQPIPRVEHRAGVVERARAFALGSARRIRLTLAASVIVVVLAAALGVQGRTAMAGAGSEVRELPADARSVPMLDAVLEDYVRVTAADLPGRARDLAAVRSAVPFPVEPLEGARLRLLAAWTTDLRGEPAAVLAYRQDDALILQYLVSEQFFFRHPTVRAAVSARHVLAASDGPRGIIAWPEAAAGSLLVADMDSQRLVGLWTAVGAR